MNKYLKKFGIMFVMSLILSLGFCISAFAATDDGVVGTSNLNGTVQNSAKIGDQLKLPEVGWKRYDDTDKNINYFSQITSSDGTACYNNTDHSRILNANYDMGYIKFNFYGSKLRIISRLNKDNFKVTEISFDGGKTFESCSQYSQTASAYCALVSEKTGLQKKMHNVIIKCPALYSTGTRVYFDFDAIDIDDDGYIAPYSDPVDESISLDKSSLDLSVGNSEQLTATTTPAEVEVNWTSSDTSVATVDSNGKVTGAKAGQATITATTADGSNLSASCTVNVTRGGNTDPTQPTTGDANLFIELVDGQIKQYSVSQDEINKFTTWFENRDKDHSLSATYKFAKGSYSDYVVHDQIDWFEVR